MKLIRDSIRQALTQTGCVLTIGNFDGVHLGHATLLKSLKQKSIDLNVPSVVMIFEPQPLEFLNPEKAPTRLTSLREKYQLIKTFGIDFLYVVRFNAQFSNITAEQWIQVYLIDILNVKAILMGEDFRFGRNRQGDIALLKKQGRQQSFMVESLETVMQSEKRMSSTLIRTYLAQSQLQLAAELLGRPYSIQGNVIYGNQLARQFGFPTANLNMDRKNPALLGVYFVKIHHKETNQFYFGVANIGFRPTIDGKKAVLEAHLFEFDEMIYGQHLEIIFLRKIRDEKKFGSIEALKEAIVQDICKAKQIQAE